MSEVSLWNWRCSNRHDLEQRWLTCTAPTIIPRMHRSRFDRGDVEPPETNFEETFIGTLNTRLEKFAQFPSVTLARKMETVHVELSRWNDRSADDESNGISPIPCLFHGFQLLIIQFDRWTIGISRNNFQFIQCRGLKERFEFNLSQFGCQIDLCFKLTALPGLLPLQCLWWMEGEKPRMRHIVQDSPRLSRRDGPRIVGAEGIGGFDKRTCRT